MAEINRKPAGWTETNDDLDRALDAALAKYAAEPRIGLEARVLANLRSAQADAPQRTWLRWAPLSAAAVVLIAGLVWKTGTKPNVAFNQTVPVPQVSPLPQNSAVQPETGAKTIVRMTAHHPRHASRPARPRLDQFPSPQPLSQQEQLLASYVSQFHDQAVLVARARAEMAAKDRERELQWADQPQQDPDRTNR